MATPLLGFYDTFKTLVHDNPEYPAVHKFYILKNALKGDVTSVITPLMHPKKVIW